MAKYPRSYDINTVNKKPSRAETQHLMEKWISAGCKRLGFSVLVCQFSISTPLQSISWVYGQGGIYKVAWVSGWRVEVCVCLGEGGCM